MNRLKIVQKYMTLDTKISSPNKYKKAQKLHKKIIAIQDRKILKTI